MIALSYCRVSGVSQTDGDGFPRQFETQERYANNHGHSIFACFYEAFTGTREDRPAFLAMLNFCQESGIKTVLIERMDRLARKFSTGEALIAACQKAGVTIINTSTGDILTDDSPDPDNWFIGSLFLLMAEWDKRKVVHRFNEAKTRIRKQGRKCDGPKGYSEIPQWAHVVETARQHRNSGSTYLQIADILNSQGIPTMKNKRWHASTVRQMLNADETHAPTTSRK